ncbi:MAG TPA: WG repeat-containing protein [Bacteroidia bacterium]|nr:WG repeat-containing protein [Bacteroidia bacterium]
MRRTGFCLIFAAFLGSAGATGGLEKAFDALRVYDYFKARHLLYRAWAIEPQFEPAYGLALIFSRNDNPFHQYDSAAKYIQQALLLFRQNPLPAKLSGFVINDSALISLHRQVARACFQTALKQNTVGAYETFLSRNYLAPDELLGEITNLRDELEFQSVYKAGKSYVTLKFINCHPLSSFRDEALNLLQRQLYEEATPNKSAPELVRFLDQSAVSAMRPTALDLLYRIYRQNSDKEGLAHYVRAYPEAPQCHEAWKLLFTLHVRSYSDDEVIRFLALYPDFPLRNSILRELEFSALRLFPVRLNGLYAFVDSTSRIKIKPIYDSASLFQEGLAIVSRNDSVWFINKLNEAVFAQIYEEALPFKSGTAAVKEHGSWKFINRQGQVISPEYEEINELCEGVYTVKSHGQYGALNEYGQRILPAQYEYLGNFKNGLAIYRENDLYGFVDKEGFQQRAIYDWISDFDEYGLAVFRINNRFGLVNLRGEALLPAEYDQIMALDEDYFMLIQNNRYGFYHKSSCFVTAIAFDYQKDKPAAYYYRNHWFRLIKTKSQALVDANGVLRVNFGVYEDCGFFGNGLLPVKKHAKWGYVDRKLQTAVPLKYDWAGEFVDSLALTRKGLTYEVIDLNGKLRFRSDKPLERFGSRYFLRNVETGMQILNASGDVFCDQILEIQRPEAGILALVLKNQEVRLMDTETFVILPH